MWYLFSASQHIRLLNSRYTSVGDCRSPLLYAHSNSTFWCGDILTTSRLISDTSATVPHAEHHLLWLWFFPLPRINWPQLTANLIHTERHHFAELPKQHKGRWRNNLRREEKTLVHFDILRYPVTDLHYKGERNINVMVWRLIQGIGNQLRGIILVSNAYKTGGLISVNL